MTAWFRSPFVVVLVSLVLQAGGREAETEREKRRIPRRRVNRPIRAGWWEHSIYMFKARLIPPCHAGAESRPQVPWPRDDAVSTWDGGDFLADPWGAMRVWKFGASRYWVPQPLTISFLRSIVGPCFEGGTARDGEGPACLRCSRRKSLQPDWPRP